jgi:hypothetical protein
MANREQRGNREKRKPKAEKPKAAAAQSPFGQVQAKDQPKGYNATKKR